MVMIKIDKETPMNTKQTAATLSRLLLIITLFASPLSAQRRRQPAPRPPQPAAPAQPAPTFETVLAAGSYRIYGEVRGVGQLLRSSSVDDVLDPTLKLASPPKEFKTLVEWLDARADALISSRLLFAASPARPNLPQVLMVVEFPSVEEAQRFEPQLKKLLPKLMPTPSPKPEGSPSPTPQGSPSPTPAKAEDAQVMAGDNVATSNPGPNFILKQAGALIIISESTFTLKDLRPAGSKSLAEDPNFRQVHNRFTSESLFVYFDIAAFEKEDQERRRVWEEEEQKRKEQEVLNPTRAEEEEIVAAPPPPVADPSGPPPYDVGISSTPGQTEVELSTAEDSNQQPPKAFATSMLSMLAGAFFTGPPEWPEAIGLAINFEPDTYVVRALMLSGPDRKGSILPFMPMLVSGPPLAPEAASILPADTELLITASLDYQQMYDALAKNLAIPPEMLTQPATVKDITPESPFASYEAKLGIKIKEDLIPLLGNEVAVSFPLKAFGLAAPQPSASPETPGEPGTEKKQASAEPQPIVAISVKDREAVRALIPKIIDSMGVKGASMLAQSEKRGDTELVTYLDVASYAFIGNFLVASPDSKAVRHVVDSYLNHQTLGSDTRFHNATRWQPRQLLGQVYIPTELMQDYYQLMSGSAGNDKLREYISRLNPFAEPVTYALSNDGIGPLHELHLPKNLVMFMIAGMASESNQPPEATNEAVARSILRVIASAEMSYQLDPGNGSFGTLDQLIEKGMLSKEMLDKYGYKIELTVLGARFEATAVPIEYGKTGKLSFFIDESQVLRGGDHGGGPATVADNPVR